MSAPPHAMLARPLAAADVAAIHDLATAAAARHRAPALAWGVVAGGALVAAGGAGDPGDGGGVPDARTLFRIASMTKSFTAAAVLHLRDAGRLALDDAVVRHVPAAAGLRGPTRDSPAITVRHLLTMSAGMATDDAWADRHLDVARDDLLRRLRGGASFAAPPGTVHEYSNLGYGVLGQVVESAAGVPLQAYVSRHLLAPLGMADTVWEAAQAEPSRRVARPHRVVDGVAVPDAPPLGDGGLGPMGGLWSTVADLARWVAFLAGAFPPRDDPDEAPLGRASRREMQQLACAFPAALVRDDVLGPLRLAAGGYAMGLRVLHHLQLGTIVTHSGGLPGFGSNMMWLPDRGVGAIALACVTYADMASLDRDVLELLRARDLLLSRPRPTAPALERAAAELARLLSDWDDGRAAALFADNVALDDPLDRRRAAAAGLRERHGAVRVASVAAERATRGAVELVGERGTVRVELQLSPENPPRVQKYDVTSVLPASEALMSLASRLAALAGTADPATLAPLLDPATDLDDAARRLRAAHTLFGRMTVGATVAGGGAGPDGMERATLRWHGERGDLDVTVVLRAGRAALEAMAPRRVPDA
jgi:CubicO group peptidase (beta-lactamase class C family)